MGRMWRDLRENWREPGFWSWWWREVVRSDAKVALVICLALVLGLAGYVSAEALSSATRTAAVVESQRVTTLQQTVVRSVTREREVPVTRATTDVVTVAGSPRTVVVPAQGSTVTVQQPGLERVVTDALTQTVVASKTVDRPVTVVQKSPGATRTVVRQAPPATQTVVTPGPTETVVTPGPTQTVVRDGPTKTVTGPAQTVTRETTLPAETITLPSVTVTAPTRTVTETRTVTDQVTVTQPVTVTVGAAPAGPK
jgi:hypothetical protein